jgi:hypothetical protein
MDAIELLTRDHEAVRQLFKQFDAAGEDAGKTNGRRRGWCSSKRPMTRCWSRSKSTTS